MAKEVVIVDDLDNSKGAQTVEFGFEGLTYEIDLADKNMKKLSDALAPFIERARRVSAVKRGGKTAAPRPAARTDKEQLKAIREWAQAEGLEVSNRGRIPQEILDKYQAAHK